MSPASSSFRTIRLFNLDFFAGSTEDLLEFLSEKLQKNSQDLLKIFTPNPEQIVLADTSPAFARSLEQADLLLPDGGGVVWTAKLKGKHLQRITGVDTAQLLLELAKDQRALLIGGREYADNKLSKWPNLTWILGYENIQKPTMGEEAIVKQVIGQLKPAVIFVAFGAPAQEQWVIQHEQLLQENNVRIAMVVGGAFDMLTGKVSRAPELIQKIGLEWLFRLIQQPWRWKRQLKLLKFIGLALR
jgi:N-acetylglucosaminyldiphosphoundecaprenol N-acetyl-beta-D-mannosaminyltransferase